MTQLEALCEKKRIKITARLGVRAKPTEWSVDCNGWRVTMSYQGRQMTCDFWTGQMFARDPNAADVLSSLILDSGALDVTFSEWCSEFGYDSDSRKALATYDKCRRLGSRVRKFLGRDFDKFAQAEH